MVDKQAVVAGVYDGKVAPLLKDDNGGTAYGINYDIPLINDVDISDRIISIEIKGDDELSEVITYVEAVEWSFKCSKESLDLFKTIIGGTITESGTTQQAYSYSSALKALASGIFTLSGTVSDGEVVIIGPHTYEFHATEGSIGAGNIWVDITGDTTAADNIDGLITAIVANSNSLVSAVDGGDSATIAANILGPNGNHIITSTTCANGSFAETTLTGGAGNPGYFGLGVQSVMTASDNDNVASCKDYLAKCKVTGFQKTSSQESGRQYSVNGIAVRTHFNKNFKTQTLDSTATALVIA